MSDDGEDGGPAGGKGGADPQAPDATAAEEDLSRAFRDLESEPVPGHLRRIAEKLDRAIAEVIRRKTN